MYLNSLINNDGIIDGGEMELAIKTHCYARTCRSCRGGVRLDTCSVMDHTSTSSHHIQYININII